MAPSGGIAELLEGLPSGGGKGAEGKPEEGPPRARGLQSDPKKPQETG